MKFNDAIIGVFLIIFAIIEILYARTFPTLFGQQIGPSEFPILIGIGLAFCGAVLIMRGLRLRYKNAIVGGALVSVGEWIESNAAITNFALVLLSILFFILAVDDIGFVITSFLILALLFKRFGNSFATSMIGAAIMTGATKYLFGFWLLVPLPIGQFGL